MKWQDLWSYQQQDYRSWPSQIQDQWQVIRIRINQQGKFLRINFGNLYGVTDLVFDKVVAQLLSYNGKKKSLELLVTENDEQIIRIPKGCTSLKSDILHFEYFPGDILEIKTYVKTTIPVTSGIVSYSRLQQEVLNYRDIEDLKTFIDQKDVFRMVKENSRMFLIYGVVSILGEKSGSTFIAFGDSLTQQGFWVDHLKQRLIVEGYNNITIANRGIGGGRILQDTDPTSDNFQRHGRSGIKRYLLDITDVYGATDIIISYGINDVSGLRKDENSEYLLREIINSYIFFAEEAKLRNFRIYITTLMPMKKSIFSTPHGELLRRKVNHWIRKNEYFDDVIDFESFVEDPSNLGYLFSTYDCGDGLHLSSEGGKAIARQFPVQLIHSSMDKLR